MGSSEGLRQVMTCLCMNTKTKCDRVSLPIPIHFGTFAGALLLI